jgi:WXG100 family type VII secretion target
MAGQVQVDAGLMQVTAQQSATIADNMLTQAKTLVTGLEFVRSNWRGAAGDAFRATTEGQKAVLDKLVQRLQFVSETIKRGGQGFDSQDTDASGKLNLQGQQFLNAPLNH